MSYPLDAPLPVEVVAGGQSVWFRYRRYPVFSWSWLRGRSLLFGVAIAAFTVLVGIGLAATTGSALGGAMSGLHFAVGFMLICTSGPLLASMVRQARMPLRRERVGVVLAVALGVVISYFADAWSSGYLKAHIPRSDKVHAVVKPPEISPAWKATAQAANLVTLILIYGALGGGFALRAYFGEQRRWQDSRNAAAMAALRAQKQQADLRLGVLQAQVEPHFLFNTLASVRAQLRQQPAQAEAALDALVDYLRATIPRLRDEENALHSTLGQQLDLCASYLELMRLRTEGRLSYAIEVDPALREISFPPMLLIGLVENAIKHGLEPKPGPGRVTVSAAREGAQLRIDVVDDGLGLRPGVGGGLGLSNLRAQLETRYGAGASFVLEGGPHGGARASLRIPLETPA